MSRRGKLRGGLVSVNKAVAVQTDKSRVAICLEPKPRFEVDGKPVELGEGRQLELLDGGDVVRRGNVYIVRGPSGDSVRAVINSTYIDVSVGLGGWPTKVRGLLADAANGKVNEIETGDGIVLTSPFWYETLYGHYADSWQVPSNELLLSTCGDVQRGIPKQLFFANNLDKEVAKRTRAICEQAGVQQGPLMDTCMLDVAMIGSEAAAKVFTGRPNPIAVGDARSRRPPGASSAEGAGQTMSCQLFQTLSVAIRMLDGRNDDAMTSNMHAR